MINTWINENSSRFWKKWLLVLGIAIIFAVLALFFVDQQFAQYFGSPELVRVWLFHRNITEVGAAEIYIGLSVVGLLYKPIRKRCLYLLACMLTSGIVIHLIKFSVGRARAHKAPDSSPFVIDPFNFHHHWHSFPSGHSQTLFTAATVLAFTFPRTAPYIFILAFYLALTRAVTLAHFTSDVIMGSVLGVLVSVLTLRVLVKKYGT